MKEKTLYSKRDWLNPKGHYDSGAILSKVSVDEHGIDCDITIWDCSRKISLDLGAWNGVSVKQRAKKISLMIKHLQEVQQALGKAYNIVIEEGVFEDSAE